MSVELNTDAAENTELFVYGKAHTPLHSIPAALRWRSEKRNEAAKYQNVINMFVMEEKIEAADQLFWNARLGEKSWKILFYDDFNLISSAARRSLFSVLWKKGLHSSVLFLYYFFITRNLITAFVSQVQYEFALFGVSWSTVKRAAIVNGS